MEVWIEMFSQYGWISDFKVGETRVRDLRLLICAVWMDRGVWILQ